MNNKTGGNLEKVKGSKSKDKNEDVGQPQVEAGEETEEEAAEAGEEAVEEAREAEEEVGEEFGLVSNIPPSWHTSDLRRHFMDWVEGGLFTTFHFRHRPEKGRDVAVVERARMEEKRQRIDLLQKYSEDTCSRVHLPGGPQKTTKTSCCCIVRVAAGQLDSLIAKYHRKHWLDSSDTSMSSKCFVSRVSLPPPGEGGYSPQDLASLPELAPPNVMPRGNVGTSTAYFMAAIKACRLPASIIGKLKLDFPQSRRRKYSSVPLYYRGNEALLDRRKLQQANVSGPSIESVHVDSDPEDDNDTCEEWERHEALHNDVQPNRSHGDGQADARVNGYLPEGGDLEQQSGTKNIPFEGDVELVWEKGGSGLNFYTDSAYWKAQEGDFDERNTDDWDVDMSVYYEKDLGARGHDKDANDAVDMRRTEFFRKGKHSESVFGKKKTDRRTPSEGRKRKNYWTEEEEDERIGAFESHGRGVASKIMAKAGWQAGKGLGATGREGTPTPVMIEEDEGHHPRDKRGMGYHGVKLQGFTKPLVPKHRISTAYSGVGARDPAEKVDRSNPPLYMKYRDQPVKFCRGGVERPSSSSKLVVGPLSGSSSQPVVPPPKDSTTTEVVAAEPQSWEAQRRMVELGGGERKERYPQLGRIEIEDLEF